MGKHNIKEMTKNMSWSTDSATNSDLQVSCLMRIADATEIMAKNYAQMQNDLDFYKSGYDRRGADIQKMERSNSALRGIITRMKASKNEDSVGN